MKKKKELNIRPRLLVWSVARVLSHLKIFASEEAVREWIKGQPEDKQLWYLPMPMIIGNKFENSAPQKKNKKIKR